jgi:hypothetical protein
MASEYLVKIKCDERLRRRFLIQVRFGNFGVARVPPLPPTPVKCLTGAGFAKSVCKILRAKELEVKILKTKELGCFLGPAHILSPP